MPSHEDRVPVVLVPGAFGQDFVYWNVMRYCLERDGFEVSALNFPQLTLSDLRASAELLKCHVENTLDGSGHEKVALLGHSMGGLISRYYLQFLAGDERVASLVCLGTPHQGTYAAIPGLPLKGARQVMPGSAFLEALNARDAHAGPPFLNVWSRTDVIVIPQTSARFERPGVTNRAITFAGHWGLLVSPKSYAWTREWLEQASGASTAAARGLDVARESANSSAIPARGEARRTREAEERHANAN